MPENKQFVGRWVTWKGLERFEQELYADGRFDATVFDENDTISAVATGNWEVDRDRIRWHYKKGDGIRIPRYVDVNRIVCCDKQRFSVLERDGRRTDFYRAVKCVQTSTNLDLKQVRPFLKRLAGFAASEIDSVVKKIANQKPNKHGDFVFPIVSVFPVTFQGAQCPFTIRVIMDDIDAPDVYFYAPPKLAKRIDTEIQKLVG